MHYTYAHIRKDTGKIFYIGKGTKYRCNESRSRNQYWHNIVNKYGFYVEILANWKTAEEAYDHEKLLISCFKDMGYELANLTDGGEGCINPTIETKLKISASLTGKKRPKEVCEKVSKSHLGKKLSEKHKQNISKSLFGKKRSLEFIEKSKKRTHTEESKKKISLANIGKTHSQETKDKMKAAWTARKARKND